MRRFLIDTDTASDDAVALVMALRYPGVEVEAITVVAGNVTVDQGVQNALYTVELCRRQTPVYRGAEAPLRRPLETAERVHGEDGMGDVGLPLTGRRPTPGDAVEVLVDTVRRHPGEISLVALGPLTNVALALERYPGFAGAVRSLVMMGGLGRLPGNVTPVAEYNIWVDPEAARAVFASGLPITMVGWDVSRTHAVITPENAAALRRGGTRLAAFCVDIQRSVVEYARDVTRLEGFDLPDPLAMAVALDPAVVTASRKLHVDVETGSELCRGQTVIDHLGVTGREPNTEVVLEASRQRFLEILFRSVGGRSP